MKRILIIVLIICCLYITYKNNNETVRKVSLNYTTDFKSDDYNVFYLDVSDMDITTNNLSKYILSDMTVINLTPYVNPIYKNKISNLKYEFDTNLSYQRNIKKFINYYKQSIKDTGYIDDINYIDIDGIKIEEVVVYSKGSDIIELLDNNKSIKYKTVFKGDYKYLGV